MKILFIFLGFIIISPSFSGETTAPKANFAKKLDFFKQFEKGQSPDPKKPILNDPQPKPRVITKPQERQELQQPQRPTQPAAKFQSPVPTPTVTKIQEEFGCTHPVSGMEQQIIHRCSNSGSSLGEKYKGCTSRHLKDGTLSIEIRARRLGYLSHFVEDIAAVEKKHCDYVSFFASGDAAQAFQLHFSKIIEDISSQEGNLRGLDDPGSFPREDMEYATVKDFKKGASDRGIVFQNPNSTRLNPDSSAHLRSFLAKIASVSLSLLDTASGDSSFDFFISHQNVELNHDVVINNIKERLNGFGVHTFDKDAYKRILVKYERLVDKVLVQYLVHKNRASDLVYLSKPWGVSISPNLPPSVSIANLLKDYQNLTQREFEVKYDQKIGGISGQIKLLREKEQFQARILTTSPVIHRDSTALKYYLYYAPTAQGGDTFKEGLENVYKEFAFQIINDLLQNNVTDINGKPLSRARLANLKSYLMSNSARSYNQPMVSHEEIEEVPVLSDDITHASSVSNQWGYTIADEVKIYFLQKYEDLVKMYNAQAKAAAQTLNKYAPSEMSTNVRPEQKEVTRSIQGIKYSVPRPNHGLAHGLRQGFLIVDILNVLNSIDFNDWDKFGLTNTTKKIIKNIQKQLKAAGDNTPQQLQAVASFMKSGRIDEGDGTNSYKTSLQRDAVNFYKFAQKHPREFPKVMRGAYALVLTWGLNPNNELRILDPDLEDLLEKLSKTIEVVQSLTKAAHRFDLGRLPSQSYILDNKRTACLDMFHNDSNLFYMSYSEFPDVIQNVCDNMWQRAREYLIATGDHHYNDDGTWMPHDDKFFLLAANPHHMVDTLEEARQNSKITDFFSPLKERKWFNPH